MTDTSTVSASSTSSFDPNPSVRGVSEHDRDRSDRRDGQADGGERRAERQVHGSLQAVDAGGPQRGQPFGHQHHGGDHDSYHRLRCPERRYPLINRGCQRLGQAHHRYERDRPAQSGWLPVPAPDNRSFPAIIDEVISLKGTLRPFGTARRKRPALMGQTLSAQVARLHSTGRYSPPIRFRRPRQPWQRFLARHARASHLQLQPKRNRPCYLLRTV